MASPQVAVSTYDRWMRNSQLGASGLTVIGAILLVLGGIAIAAAPEIMNSSEINTLRGIGGGIAALGAILLAVGMSKNKK
jgi:hypothetical protein